MSQLSIVADQYRNQVIRPVLQHLGYWSQAAENLIVGTGLVESQFHYIAQIEGPAQSVFQIEPTTIDDNIKNFLRYRQSLDHIVDDFDLTGPFNLDETHFFINPFFACAHVRVWYLRHSEPFPHADDIEGLAQYWKKYYNTSAGKGEVSKFVQLYSTYGVT